MEPMGNTCFSWLMAKGLQWWHGMAAGKGKTSVSSDLPNEWVMELEARGQAIDQSRAHFLRLIVKQWWNAGKPPVSEPDRIMQLAKGAKPKR